MEQVRVTFFKLAFYVGAGIAAFAALLGLSSMLSAGVFNVLLQFESTIFMLLTMVAVPALFAWAVYAKDELKALIFGVVLAFGSLASLILTAFLLAPGLADMALGVKLLMLHVTALGVSFIASLVITCLWVFALNLCSLLGLRLPQVKLTGDGLPKVDIAKPFKRINRHLDARYGDSNE